LKNEITHQQLVALKDGDVESFNLIYREYRSIIYYYILKFVQQKNLAEEATADVFVLLWKKRTIIKPQLPIQAFLYKLAKDTAYNYLKKIASDDKLRQQYLENYPILEIKNGELLFLEKEQSERVNQIIATLPPKRLAVFKLRYYEGLDNKTIAQKLGISINTVKVHLAKARLYLKAQLSNDKELSLTLFLIGIFNHFL